MDAQRGAEDTRLVQADLVSEIQQVALELLARDDEARSAWGRFLGIRHATEERTFPPAAADFLSNPLAVRHLRCPVGKQKGPLSGPFPKRTTRLELATLSLGS